MNDGIKTRDASPIPAPLRDWLDKAIIAQMSESQISAEDTLNRRTSIANAILYPLEKTSHKTKVRVPR
jgi:hypothetical protein